MKLKSGCAMERLRLRSGERLKPALGVAALIAVRLLQLRAAARQDPTASALRVMDPHPVHTPARRSGGDAEGMSVHQFRHRIARWGGCLGRSATAIRAGRASGTACDVCWIPPGPNLSAIPIRVKITDDPAMLAAGMILLWIQPLPTRPISDPGVRSRARRESC